MRSVAVVVFSGVQAIDVSGPMEVFEEANALLPDADRYLVEVVGSEGIFAVSNGMRMEAHRTYDEATAGYDPKSPLAAISEFVMANLRSRLTVDELADHIHMSRRSFARLFAEQARTTPAEFVENARLDAARNLLEGSRLALKEIAFECGFGTPHRMRQVFLRRLSVPPGQYRASFQQMEELSTLSLAGGGMLVATAVLPGSMSKVLEERGDCIARIWGELS